MADGESGRSVKVGLFRFADDVGDGGRPRLG
jgi:hypothetical protein